MRSRPSKGFRSGWLGTILRGWALAEQGQGEEGIAQMRQGLAAYRATGAELTGRIFLPCWLRCMGKRGRQRKGSAVLAEALALVDKTGERIYEAELYRLKGELLLPDKSGKGKVKESVRSRSPGFQKAARGASSTAESLDC